MSATSKGQQKIEAATEWFKREYGSDANPLFAFEKGYKYAKDEQPSPLLEFAVFNEWYAWDKTGMIHCKKGVQIEDVFVRREKVVEFFNQLIAGRSQNLAREKEYRKALEELVKRAEQLYAMIEYPREDMSGETALIKAKQLLKP